MGGFDRIDRGNESSSVAVAAPDHPSERAADALAPRPPRSGPLAERRVSKTVDAAGAARVTTRTGRPLPADLRARFEPRLGFDFSHVRIHTDEEAASAARAVDARAFRLGNHVAFGRDHYQPATPEGRALIAHELAHVATDADTRTLHRDYPWVQARQRRELDPARMPAGLNFELQDHRLIAHTTRTADVEPVVAMLDVLSLYARAEIDAAAVRTALTQARAGHQDGDRVSVDVTPHLPERIRSFLEAMERFYSSYRSWAAQHGTPEDIFAQRGLDDQQRRAAIDQYYRGAPVSPPEFGAACHEFAMVSASAGGGGVTPGRAPANPFSSSMDPVLDAYLGSIHGRGPFRPVPARDVQVGDIAVFRAGRAVTGLPSRIVHSAIVIRVSGGEVELLEKTNPHQRAATRTVRQVLTDYAGVGAVVHYVAPALAGLPHTASRDIGAAPPSGAFTEDVGTTAPEDTHVLFRVNSHVLRPHEDLKLFRVIARTRAPRPVRVHGYASTEGDDRYNRNLSAHRAVSIKDGLERELPAGSAVEAIAHGETAVFGGPDENRRAGIELRPPVAPAGQPAAPAPAERRPEEAR